MPEGRAVKHRPGYDAPMDVILASRSPRRFTLLQNAGLSVEVCPSHIDETPLADETVGAMVARLSRAKAEACKTSVNIPIIAADTLVSIHGRVLGQPKDLQQAKHMLQQLSGHEHHVLTAVCVRFGRQSACETVTTSVVFRSLTEREIDTYLTFNEVLDKAGGYAVQGGAASFIEAINGPLDNVIGLPVRTTLNMIEHLTQTMHE
jgi:septum formation protein